MAHRLINSRFSTYLSDPADFAVNAGDDPSESWPVDITVDEGRTGDAGRPSVSVSTRVSLSWQAAAALYVRLSHLLAESEYGREAVQVATGLTPTDHAASILPAAPAETAPAQVGTADVPAAYLTPDVGRIVTLKADPNSLRMVGRVTGDTPSGRLRVEWRDVTNPAGGKAWASVHDARDLVVVAASEADTLTFSG